MDEPRTPGPRPPQEPSRQWPIYVFIALVIIVILGIAAIAASRPGGPFAASATATSTALPATATPHRPTATPRATKTPTATATTGPRPPTNPTTLRAVSGSCTVHALLWTWSGAERATAYDVIAYDPTTKAEVKHFTSSTPSFTLPVAPGTQLALKVRSRNDVGTASTYYAPADTASVPIAVTNPTTMTATTSGRTLTWTWSGALHADGYEVFLYHYQGTTDQTDLYARTTVPHWSVTESPGTIYYLKVRSLGSCSGHNPFFKPAVPATAVAGTPTSGPTTTAAGSTPTPIGGAATAGAATLTATATATPTGSTP